MTRSVALGARLDDRAPRSSDELRQIGAAARRAASSCSAGCTGSSIGPRSCFWCSAIVLVCVGMGARAAAIVAVRSPRSRSACCSCASSREPGSSAGSPRFAVTDRRVIYKRGFIKRHTEEMNMDKVDVGRCRPVDPRPACSTTARSRHRDRRRGGRRTPDGRTTASSICIASRSRSRCATRSPRNSSQTLRYQRADVVLGLRDARAASA